MDSLEIKNLDITQEVEVYETVSNANLDDIYEIMKFCDKQNWQYIYDKEVKILKVGFVQNYISLSIKDGKIQLSKSQEYINDAIFLKNNPSSYERIIERKNFQEYRYRNITKIEYIEDNEKVIYKYSETDKEMNYKQFFYYLFWGILE